MKKFLAVFMGSTNPAAMEKWQALDEATRKQKEKDGMAAWKAWAVEHQKNLELLGGPLGKTKKIDAKGVSDYKNLLAGFSIVRAETADEAAKIFLKHPHFTIFPGDSVEVVEILPVPDSK